MAMERVRDYRLEPSDEPTNDEDYHSDVTPEAVERVRERAREAMEGAEWEQVDGFGTVER